MEFLKWFSTACLIIGAGLTAFHITSINTTFFFVGSVGWTLVGLKMRDHAITAVNGVCASLYLAGWIYPDLFNVKAIW